MNETIKMLDAYRRDVTIDSASLPQPYRSARRLVEVLKEVAPYMEAAEELGLVGDEGCHWAVEQVRALLAEIEEAP